MTVALAGMIMVAVGLAGGWTNISWVGLGAIAVDYWVI